MAPTNTYWQLLVRESRDGGELTSFLEAAFESASWPLVQGTEGTLILILGKFGKEEKRERWRLPCVTGKSEKDRFSSEVHLALCGHRAGGQRPGYVS